MQRQDVSAACLYIAAKTSLQPQSPRSILNVYAYLLSSAAPLLRRGSVARRQKQDPESYYLSESTYIAQRAQLIATESLVLCTLGFNTHVVLPHTLALTYLQTLGAMNTPPTAQSRSLARRTIEHLNSALLSPQLLYLTHQPNKLAAAATYLAAREVGVKLPEGEWWRVFDCDREELGFLVVGMSSMPGWAEREKERLQKRGALWRVQDVEMDMEREGN
jgi:hypothetical protein